MELIDRIKETKIVPVVVLKKLEDTIPTLSALCEGGLPVAEITFRTACAADAIRLGCEKFPDMLIGAGTVINAAQARAAVDAGAQFIVSPGLGLDIARVCREADIPYIPGCVTPTEIMQAISTVGFPIVACCILFYLYDKTLREVVSTLQDVSQTLREVAETLRKCE